MVDKRTRGPSPAAISQKIQNQEKMEKEMQKAEGGAKFPPSAPPASMLVFLGIFVTNAKGKFGEKTMVRSRTSGFEPTFWKNERNFAGSLLSAITVACLQLFRNFFTVI